MTIYEESTFDSRKLYLDYINDVEIPSDLEIIPEYNLGKTKAIEFSMTNGEEDLTITGRFHLVLVGAFQTVKNDIPLIRTSDIMAIYKMNDISRESIKYGIIYGLDLWVYEDGEDEESAYYESDALTYPLAIEAIENGYDASFEFIEEVRENILDNLADEPEILYLRAKELMGPDWDSFGLKGSIFID